MQWDDALPNAGFSTGPAESLYLPLDPRTGRPTVAAQMNDPHSLLHFVQGLVHLRRSTPALGTATSRRPLSVGYPLAYLRNETHLVVVNPLRRAMEVKVELPAGTAARHLYGNGATLDDGMVPLAGGLHCHVELSGGESQGQG